MVEYACDKKVISYRYTTLCKHNITKCFKNKGKKYISLKERNVATMKVLANIEKTYK